MKNFIKLISSAALLVMFTFALSSYDTVQQPADDPGNGVVVIVNKGDVWSFSTGCGTYAAMKSTTQWKDGQIHMVTRKYDIGKDNCLVKKNAYKLDLWSSYGPTTAVITPSGMVIEKQIVNN